MRSPFTRLISLGAFPALLVGMLAASPAEAATSYVVVTTESIAVDSVGNAKVWAKCTNRSKGCYGKIWFHGGSAKSQSFTIAKSSAEYVDIKLDKANNSSVDPWVAGGTGPLNQKPAKVRVQESNGAYKDYDVTLEKRVATQTIRASVSGNGLAPSDVRVTMHRVSGLKTTRIGTDYKAPYEFKVALGTNNASSAAYRLSVSGLVDGARHEWFYRSSQAGRYIAEGSDVRAAKTAAREIVFAYGDITGQVTGTSHTSGIKGATVRIAAVPVTMPSSSIDLRELDVPYCANDFETVKTNSAGNYTASFLPASGRYVVQVAAPAGLTTNYKPYMTLWNSAKGTCLGVRDLDSTHRLVGPYNPELAASDAKITGKLSFSATPTYNDRYVILRTADKNRTIVDRSVAPSSSNRYTFENVAPGKYVVEYARRPGCTDWYPSRYTDNYAYLQGEDRGNERWKTVNGKYAEYEKSNAMGYTAKTPPSGYRGWMYRDHCAEIHAEHTSSPREVTGPAASQGATINFTLNKGAWVSGRVSREGGKSNKEMLVIAYRKDNKFVTRTAITDGSGRFKMTGLASGSWSMMVNSDSWRGIGRSFSGIHTKTVTAGHGYSIGSLYAKF